MPKTLNVRTVSLSVMLAMAIALPLTPALAASGKKIKVSATDVVPVVLSDSNTIYCLGMPGEPGTVKSKGRGKRKALYFTPLTPKYEKNIAKAKRKADRKPSIKNVAKLNVLIAKLAEMQRLCTPQPPNPNDPDSPDDESKVLQFAETPRAVNIDAESATIIVQTNKPTKAEVHYGTILGAPEFKAEDIVPAGVHQLELADLKAETTYHALVRVTDRTGATLESQTSFTTSPQTNQFALDKIGVVQTREKQTLKLALKTSNPTGGAVRFSLSRGPSFLSLTSTGTNSAELTFAPGDGTVGDHPFAVTAISADGQSVSGEGLLKVYRALPPEPPAGEPGVFMGAELAHKDRFLPNFGSSFNAPGQTIVTSSQDGNWSALFGTLGQNAILVIRHRVVFDMPLAVIDRVVVYPGGALIFNPDVNTELRVTTLQVMKGALLEVGTAARPIRDNVSAAITFRDRPFDLDIDPGQYGNGLVNFGTVIMHGRSLSRSWVRLAVEPKAGDAVLTLSEAVTGWMPGDKIVIPDSSPVTNFSVEENAVSRVSGNLLFLERPLVASHVGARSTTGQLEYLPHVGNLGRNIVLRSENPEGTRGHTIHLGRAHVDLRYVRLSELGRTKALVPGIIEKDKFASHLHSTKFNADGTPSQIGTNQIGRYALHFHHAIGPVAVPASGYQQVLSGLAIDGSPKWGIAIHGTHFTLVQDNVVYRAIGAGIVTEDGSETENLIARNFVLGSLGSGQSAIQRSLGLEDFAHEGTGFWFHSGNNRVIGNVAANNKIGFNDFRLSLTRNLTYPIARGDDPHMADQALSDPTPDRLPFLDFNNNEAYAGAVGLEIWNVLQRPEGVDRQMNPRGDLRGGISTMKNSVVWHQTQKLVFAGNGRPNVFRVDGLVGRQFNPGTRGPCIGHGVSSSSAYTSYLEFNNIDIQGAEQAIDDARHGWVLTNSKLQSCRNIITEFSPGTDHTVRNTIFLAMPGKPLDVLYMKLGRLTEGNSAFGGYTFGAANPARFLIYDYQGIPGNNREVFIPQQLAARAMYARTSPGAQVGCPEEGLSVRQCFDRYGLAPLGQVATCAVTEDGFNTGAVCPFSGTTAPPMQYHPQPRVLISRPLPGEVVKVDVSGDVYARGAITGDPTNLKEGNTFYYQVDSLAPRASTGYLGERGISIRMSKLTPGTHTLRAWLVDKALQVVPGSEDSRTFTVSPP